MHLFETSEFSIDNAPPELLVKVTENPRTPKDPTGTIVVTKPDSRKSFHSRVENGILYVKGVICTSDAADTAWIRVLMGDVLPAMLPAKLEWDTFQNLKLRGCKEPAQTDSTLKDFLDKTEKTPANVFDGVDHLGRMYSSHTGEWSSVAGVCGGVIHDTKSHLKTMIERVRGDGFYNGVILFQKSDTENMRKMVRVVDKLPNTWSAHRRVLAISYENLERDRSKTWSDGSVHRVYAHGLDLAIPSRSCIRGKLMMCVCDTLWVSQFVDRIPTAYLQHIYRMAGSEVTTYRDRRSLPTSRVTVIKTDQMPPRQIAHTSLSGLPLAPIYTPLPCQRTHLGPFERLEIEPSLTVDSECSVCRELIRRPTGNRSCTHVFCYRCVRGWNHRNSSCPMCRAPFTEEFIRQEEFHKDETVVCGWEDVTRLRFAVENAAPVAKGLTLYVTNYEYRKSELAVILKRIYPGNRFIRVLCSHELSGFTDNNTVRRVVVVDTCEDTQPRSPVRLFVNRSELSRVDGGSYTFVTSAHDMDRVYVERVTSTCW